MCMRITVNGCMVDISIKRSCPVNLSLIHISMALFDLTRIYGKPYTVDQGSSPGAPIATSPLESTEKPSRSTVAPVSYTHLKTFIILALGAGMSGCGNSFLETNYYKGIDVETGLSTVDNISTALNGTYYCLLYTSQRLSTLVAMLMTILICPA